MAETHRVINIQAPPTLLRGSPAAKSARTAVSTTFLALRQKDQHELKNISNYLHKQYVSNKSQTEMLNTCLNA